MQYLVDAGRQAYGDTTLPIEPLSARAAVFAELMASQPVLSRIASDAGIPPGAITATVPSQTNEGDQGANTDDPNARLNELSAEGAPYRVTFSSQEDMPIVSIFAQAPSAEEAARMATASATTFRDYLDEVQRTDNVPEAEQVVIRPLGQATGGIVRGGGVGPAIAALAFLLTFGVLCVLILLVTGATRRWREERVHGEVGAPAETDTGQPTSESAALNVLVTHATRRWREQRTSDEVDAPAATNREQPTSRVTGSQGVTPETAEKRAAER
jgi:hypothetical protein